MKRSILRHKYALWLVAALTLASCSQDELVDDNRLPEGKYPVVIQATGLQAVATPVSRATVDGNWQGVITPVAVQVDKMAARKYNEVTASDADGYKTATLSSDTDPFYWTSSGPINVTAWWPYSDIYPEQPTVKADQDDADNFHASDLIRGELTGLTFADRNRPMTFFHQMAKVSVQLIAEDGVTFDENTSVQLVNINYVKDDDENNVTTIKTYQPDDAAYTYLALLAPQTISGGSQFIQVSVGNDNFYYTPTDDKQLEAGTAYTYTITVKADGSGIEVKEVKEGTWADSGNSETVTGKTVRAKYTADDVKKGDYIYTDGTTSDGGLRTIYTDGSMKSLSGADKPQPVAGKTVAGIVFWTPSETSTSGRTTPASLTDDKIMTADYPNCTHGLAVSLKDVSTGMAWQSSSESVADLQQTYYLVLQNRDYFVSIASGMGNTDNINKILGYQNTQVLLAYNTYCGGNQKLNYVVQPVAALTAFGENTNPAPTGSTDWFFPSLKELHILFFKDADNVYWSSGIQTRDIVNASLSAAGGDNLDDWDGYWSSSEYANDSKNAFYVDSYNGTVSNMSKNSSYKMRVRAVCAF